MKRQISMIVFLGGSLWKDFEKEAFHVKRSLLPCCEVKGEVAIVVGDGCCFWISFEQSLGGFDGSPEGSGGVQGKISTVVLDASFVSGSWIRGSGDCSFPSFREFVQFDSLGFEINVHDRIELCPLLC
jgi:hypothetical protein